MPELDIIKGKPTVELWDYEGCGIVVESPTGIHYTNQAGGSLCDHPSAEGFFLPLNNRWPEDWNKLHDLVCGFPWDEQPILENDAIVLLEDRILPNGIQVDRTRLSQAEEAWIPVVLSYGFGAKGWFTYPNCD